MVAMQNRVKVVVVMSALALAAGLLALALGAKPTQAQAETDHFNDRVPVEGVFFNECTGEFVTFEGTQHIVGHSTEDASGGAHFWIRLHSQVQGVSTSGAKYVARGNTSFHDNISSESAANFTFMETIQFIRQGSETAEDDFQSKFLFHVTVNANGELTSEVEQVDVECK
jgi:hypothetical protein